MRETLLSIVVSLCCATSCTCRKGTPTETKGNIYEGEWAEMTAERIVATFAPEGNGYRVEIGWREQGLAQYEIWEMTAENAESDTLVYSNALYYVKQYEHEEDSTFIRDTVYTDGFGTFSINTEGNLVWNDGKDSLQEATVFIRANFGEE